MQTRLERLLTTPCTLSEADYDRLLAEPSPWTVDLFGLRPRRPGEPVYRPASFEAFERSMRARHVERVGRVG